MPAISGCRSKATRTSRLVGFVDTGNSDPNRGIGFKGLKWEGHDFIDNVRDQDIWDKTQKGLEAGEFSLDLAKALAKRFIKKNVERYTGVDLNL
ncbi:DUF2513 domain-containing protein [Agrobacterium sp. 22-3674b3]